MENIEFTSETMPRTESLHNMNIDIAAPVAVTDHKMDADYKINSQRVGKTDFTTAKGDLTLFGQSIYKAVAMDGNGGWVEAFPKGKSFKLPTDPYQISTVAIPDRPGKYNLRIHALASTLSQ